MADDGLIRSIEAEGAREETLIAEEAGRRVAEILGAARERARVIGEQKPRATGTVGGDDEYARACEGLTGAYHELLVALRERAGEVLSELGETLSLSLMGEVLREALDNLPPGGYLVTAPEALHGYIDAEGFEVVDAEGASVTIVSTDGGTRLSWSLESIAHSYIEANLPRIAALLLGETLEGGDA